MWDSRGERVLELWEVVSRYTAWRRFGRFIGYLRVETGNFERYEDLLVEEDKDTLQFLSRRIVVEVLFVYYMLIMWRGN